MEKYAIIDHIHNYAIWTAARAVQRGFLGATTEKISKAIDKAGMRAVFLESSVKWTADNFKETHDKVVEILKCNLNNCTYGRAAKIVSIYIKTAVILPSKGECALSKVAYPPIDNILLSKLREKGIIGNYQKWTTIEDDKVFLEMLKQIKNHLGDKPFWKIEYYWQPD